MSANVRPLEWDAVKHEAAYLFAESRFATEEIAAKVGVTGRTLRRWKEHPDFIAKIQEMEAQIEANVFHRGIASRAKRIAALNRRWDGLAQVVEARAAEYAAKPGGQTGLLVRRLRVIGNGDNAKEVEEYEVDTGLLRELREHEKQAAQELGQWEEKHKHKVGGDSDNKEPIRTKGDADSVTKCASAFAKAVQFALDARSLREDDSGKSMDSALPAP